MKVKEKATFKKAFFWNLTGSIFNSMVSVVLSIAVVHTVGNNMAGVFSLAFAGSQLMLTIGCFEVRVYQSTDIKEKFSFLDYYSFRIVTCIAMMLSCYIYIWFYQYYIDETAIVMIILCLYRVLESISDVFQGFFQQHERLDIAGKMLAIKVLWGCVVFIGVLIYTANIVYASIGMLLAAFICFVFYDCKKIVEYRKPKIILTLTSLKKIFLECLPLFCSAFLIMYVYNAPRNSIFFFMSPDEQSYYNQLFMPAATINLLNIAFRPLLTKMAILWEGENIKGFLKYTVYIILGIVLCSIIVLLGGFFCGIPILSFLYTKELESFKAVLMIILIGSGLSAFGNIMYNIITIMRKQYSLLFGYGLTALCAGLLSNFFVSQWGLVGAASLYLCSMIVFSFSASIIFLFYIILYFKQKSKKIVWRN